MRARLFCPALVLFAAAATPAAASPATSEGAGQLARSYAEYFTRAVIDKGVVTVTPDGESYVVAWDLEKAMALLGADAGGLKMQPFAYRLTPADDGVWRLEAQTLPSLAVDAANGADRFGGSFDFHGFHLDGVYDPAGADFLRSRLGLDALVGKFNASEAAQATDVELAQSGLVGEMRAKASTAGAGVDVAYVQSIKSLAETVVLKPTSGDSQPATVAYTIGEVGGAVTLSGLRAREIGELWKYVVAHNDDSTPSDGLKTLLGAALPLWSDFKLTADLHDFSVETPVGRATIKTLAEKLGLSGLTPLASAEFGLAFDSLAFDSANAPAWSARLTPISLSLDLQFSGRGVDQAAQLALQDPGLAVGGQVTPGTQDRITAALLAGDPKLTLAPGRLTMPALDLAFAGEASMTNGAPSGHFTVSADSLDKTLELLQDIAKDEPDAQTAILGVTFVKGLAKTGPDGRLVWQIDIDEAGVTVNGEPLPTGQ
jgi:hypothetical protein